MMGTGLLLAEVHVCTVCELGAGGVSIMSMAERTLGKMGSRAASAAYLLIHYALLVAYTSKSGEIIARATGMNASTSSVVFATLVGVLIFKSNTRQMDAGNTILLCGVIASFTVLLVLASPLVNPENVIGQVHWIEVPGTLPVICLSFVYHNVVPVVSTQLEGDVTKIRTSIVVGTAVPLFMFLLWNLVILGSVDANIDMNTFDPLAQLELSSSLVAPWVQIFSLFAIASSFVGFVLGLTDFLGDAFNLRSGNKEPLPYLLTIVPPLIIAITYPGLFLSALNVAGTYGVMILFGIMPATMAYMQRYRLRMVPMTILPSPVNLVPGGKPVLISIAGISSAIILTQFFAEK